MSLRKEMLRPGDLLFFRPKVTWLVGAWFITWAQNVVGKSPIHDISYSHVALVDEDTDYLLEAKWPKTRRRKIDWEKLKKHYFIELWRVKKATKEERKLAVEWCHDNLGRWYDLGLFIWGMFDIKNAEVCSTFVAKAWKAAGRLFKIHKRIGNAHDFHSPDELIYNSDLIKQIAVSEPIKDRIIKG